MRSMITYEPRSVDDDVVMATRGLKLRILTAFVEAVTPHHCPSIFNEHG